MRRAYRARILTPREGHAEPLFLEDGLLVVDEAGGIERVEPFVRPLSKLPIRNLHPCVIVPGFVDAHVHAPQTRIVGSATGPLLDWLNASVFPEEARFLDASYARRVAREFLDRLIVSGTTTAVVFATSDPGATQLLFEELSVSGLRAVAGLTLMDQGAPEPLLLPRAAAIEASARLASTWNGFDRGRLAFALTPRFALSCSRALMEAAGALARERDLFVQTHVAENHAEDEATRRAHPYAPDYLSVYEMTGLLGPKTLLAHAIHLDTDAWRRIAKARARVVHCPDSNAFLGSGRMRLREALAHGVGVALGSDVGAGRTFNMLAAVASAYDAALAVGAPVSTEALFEAATLGGAKALGWEARVGSIEAGKEADFVVMKVPEHVRTKAQVLGHLCFAREGVSVAGAFVRGRRLLTCDVNDDGEATARAPVV